MEWTERDVVQVLESIGKGRSELEALRDSPEALIRHCPKLELLSDNRYVHEQIQGGLTLEAHTKGIGIWGGSAEEAAEDYQQGNTYQAGSYEAARDALFALVQPELTRRLEDLDRRAVEKEQGPSLEEAERIVAGCRQLEAYGFSDSVPIDIRGNPHRDLVAKNALMKAVLAKLWGRTGLKAADIRAVSRYLTGKEVALLRDRLRSKIKRPIPVPVTVRAVKDGFIDTMEFGRVAIRKSERTPPPTDLKHGYFVHLQGWDEGRNGFFDFAWRVPRIPKPFQESPAVSRPCAVSPDVSQLLPVSPETEKFGFNPEAAQGDFGRQNGA